MKSLPPESPTSSSVEIDTATAKAPGLYQKLRRVLRQFRKDLRGPLPGSEGLGKWGRFKFRCRHLVRRYGWKLVLGIVIYYLIRDSLLYIIIPYFVAKKLLG